MGFWNKVGKVVGTVIEHAPEILGALQLKSKHLYKKRQIEE